MMSYTYTITVLDIGWWGRGIKERGVEGGGADWRLWLVAGWVSVMVLHAMDCDNAGPWWFHTALC